MKITRPGIEVTKRKGAVTKCFEMMKTYRREIFLNHTSKTKPSRNLATAKLILKAGAAAERKSGKLASQFDSRSEFSPGSKS